MPTSNTESPSPAESLMQRAEEFARQEPAKAAASAFGAGLFLNFLPLSGIAGVLVSTALSFVRPALLVLGLVKAFEYCRSKNQSNDRHE